MTKYSKASDSMVNVVDADGNAHRVTQRAFDVVYKVQGYRLASDVKEVETEVKPPVTKKKKPTEKAGD